MLFGKTISLMLIHNKLIILFSSPELLEHRDSVLEIHQNESSIAISPTTSREIHVITINVSGNRFQTQLSTLETYPHSLLGDEQKRQLYWNDELKEYFFDRHRASFESNTLFLSIERSSSST